MRKGKNHLTNLLIGMCVILMVVFSTACQTGVSSDEAERTEAEVAGENAGSGDEPVISNPADALFDFEHQSDGLILDHEGDVDVELVEVGESGDKAFRTGNDTILPAQDGNVDPDCAMRFDVDDDLIFAGQPTTTVKIEITYLDEGTDTFNVQYDSLGGEGESEDGSIFTNSEIVTKTGSGEFRTATILLEDAYFANRQYGGDFRIWDQSDGAETIRRVAISLLNVEVTAQNPPSDSEAEMIPSLVYFNGNVLTLADDEVATAIAIQGDKIVAVGTDEEILASAAPNTRQIDLQGNTIMSGFIDGHTHILAFPDRLGRSFDQAQDTAIRYGFTSVNEMWADSAYLDTLFQQEEAGNLKLRVSVFTPYNLGNLDENRQKVITEFWFPGNDPILDPERHLRIPGIKIFMDGDMTEARGCWAMSDPLVANSPVMERGICGSEYGDLYWSQEDINQAVLDAQAKGYRVAFHAMGDQAIELALNAVENALNGQSNSIYRHQIEHNSMIRPDQITRCRDLDLLASIRGYADFCMPEGTVMPAFGPERTSWYGDRYVLANTIEHAYLETDYGWTVDPDDRYAQRNLDPIMHLYGLVTHKYVIEEGNVCDPVSWVAENGVSVKHALEMMTIEPAYAVSMEDYTGSLEPGKFADIIMLSGDPYSVPTDELKDLEVWMTMIGGNAEYCAAGKDVYCPD